MRLALSLIVLCIVGTASAASSGTWHTRGQALRGDLDGDRRTDTVVVEQRGSRCLFRLAGSLRACNRGSAGRSRLSSSPARIRTSPHSSRSTVIGAWKSSSSSATVHTWSSATSGRFEAAPFGASPVLSRTFFTGRAWAPAGTSSTARGEGSCSRATASIRPAVESSGGGMPCETCDSSCSGQSRSRGTPSLRRRSTSFVSRSRFRPARELGNPRSLGTIRPCSLRPSTTSSRS